MNADDQKSRRVVVDSLRATVEALAQRQRDRAAGLVVRDDLSQIERDITILKYMVGVCLLLTVLATLLLLTAYAKLK